MHAWTYDGSIAGPLIKTHVGDRLMVQLKTSSMNRRRCIGTACVSNRDGRRPGDTSQPEVKKGESFTYSPRMRDAGLYWYHPHVMSAAQVGFGLGALLGEDPADGVGIKAIR